MLRPAAGDLMREGLITCPELASFGEVARLLAEHRVHALVVTNDDGLPVGVLSDVDLLAGEWLSTDEDDLDVMRRFSAGDLMTHPIVTIDVTAPARIIAERFEEMRVSRLVVTKQGKPVGILSISDLVASLAEPAAERRVVRDVMSRAIVVALGDTPVAAAARAMTQLRSRAIVVADRTGRVMGLVTGHDLIRLHLWDVEARTIAELMRSPVTIGPDETLREAADLMLRHETHPLLVVDPDNPRLMPLGLLSTREIAAEMTAPVWVGREPFL